MFMNVPPSCNSWLTSAQLKIGARPLRTVAAGQSVIVLIPGSGDFATYCIARARPAAAAAAAAGALDAGEGALNWRRCGAR
jgi:hypothetical protein